MCGTKKLTVQNLSKTTSRDAVQRFFTKVGSIEWMGEMKAQPNGLKELALTMNSYEDADRALELHGKILDGCSIEVREVPGKRYRSLY